MTKNSIFIVAVGDIHGALDLMYENVFSLETKLSVSFDWILHVGDFGIWPYLDRVDRATRKHGDVGDFPNYFAEKKTAAKRTLFIKGNHEDFVFLKELTPHNGNAFEVLPNLYHLPNGTVYDLGGVTVGGVGGCFGYSNFYKKTKDLQGYANRHYTLDDIERQIRKGNVDILLTHDAPAGVRFPRHRQGANWASTAKGLDDLVRRVRPRICFFGHHHTRVSDALDGIPCEGLNFVGRHGNMVAIEVPIKGKDFRILGEGGCGGV